MKERKKEKLANIERKVKERKNERRKERKTS